MNTITDFDIQALIDNELSYERSKQVIGVVNDDRSARKRYEELLKQKALLKSWWSNKKTS